MSEYLQRVKRDLPIAMAHTMAMTKPGEQARMRLLNAMYCGLCSRDQLRMRAELLECLEARRGNRPAQVMPMKQGALIARW